MILTDAGPLAALVNRKDPNHALCMSASASLPGPMVTTWAVMAEAMHLARRDVGWSGQRMLLGLIENNALQVIDIEEAWLPDLAAAMERYRDRPMDLADATLYVAAAARRFTRIFSVDSDFHIYRLPNGRTLEVVP